MLLDTPLTPEMAAGFAAGVRLADGQRLQPAELSPGPDGPCSARVVLRQGVYHQIKRMFGVYGAGVNELRRTAIGGLALDAALGPGGFRELSPAEVGAYPRRLENRKKFRAKCWKLHFRRAVHRFLKHFHMKNVR